MKNATSMMKIIKKIAEKHNFDLYAADGSTLKVMNDPFMPLLITAYGRNRISVAHYYLQEGDVMWDPEICFWSYTNALNEDEAWAPYEMTQPAMYIMGRVVGGYQRLIEFDSQGHPVKIAPKAQKQAASFANTWASNIRDQGFLESDAVEIKT